MATAFLFELGQAVAISISGEQGKVIARAEYLNSDAQYLVRYKTAMGAALESWWSGEALEPI